MRTAGGSAITRAITVGVAWCAYSSLHTLPTGCLCLLQVPPHLSGTTSDPLTSVDDMNITATLWLLRLLVKYAGELKSELEQGFADTLTKP